ncbi:MAG: hypothetical protein JXJ04_10190 [Spirochaetales bacterium]|nr:hypothetical protein [Spirochaetales bacterium]
MSIRKLSPEEISEVIAKIREKYETYCKVFFKPSRLKNDFEERYRNCLKKGFDVSSFLLAEISAIEELIKKAEDKISMSPPPVKTNVAKEDFADKIIAQNLEKIQRYPKLIVHKDASEEIKRLAGGLNKIYEVHIPEIHGIFRQIEANPNIKYMEMYESRLRALAYVGKGMTPSHLSRYFAYLNRFPRDYRSIDWEEKQYILESAFLLHDMYNTLAHILAETPKLSSDLREKLTHIIEYIKNMIEDFRLKDLKRKM